MAAVDAASGLTRYRAPQRAYPRYVARRTMRPAALWGLAIGLYVTASALGYAGLAPTPAQRDVVLDTLASNVGFKALLGDTGRLHTVAGFVDWRVTGVMSLATSVWALLAATRQLRGEEAAGRWELTLAGPTNAAAHTRRALAALGSGLLVLYVIVSAATVAVATRADVAFTASHIALFGIATIAGPAQFLAIGALASQLAATRGRAVGLASAAFGVAFMVRALGDSAPSAHWLVYTSPLGWIEQIHPLDDPHPLWLIPITVFTLAAAAVAIVLAGRRDLGASIIPDRDRAVARTAMLGDPTLLALRLSRGAIIGWLTAIAAAALLYGSFAHSAGEAFAESAAIKRFAGTLAGNAQQGAQLYASVVFLMAMTLLMLYVASAMAGVRETEADGHLDNLLVRRVSRQQWLVGRAAIIAAVTVLAGLLAGACFWAGSAAQHTGLDDGRLFAAGTNATAPALLLLGMTIAAFGFVPRATAVVGYTLVAWSFLLEMLGSVITLNHWLMDTSLLHHIALAPTVDPNWRVVATYITLGVTAAAAGTWRLTRRDTELS